MGLLAVAMATIVVGCTSFLRSMVIGIYCNFLLVTNIFDGCHGNIQMVHKFAKNDAHIHTPSLSRNIQ